LYRSKASARQPFHRGDPFLENEKKRPAGKHPLIGCGSASLLPKDLDLRQVKETKPSFKTAAKKRESKRTVEEILFDIQCSEAVKNGIANLPCLGEGETLGWQSR
jgi:hypothetical protein